MTVAISLSRITICEQLDRPISLARRQDRLAAFMPVNFGRAAGRVIGPPGSASASAPPSSRG